MRLQRFPRLTRVRLPLCAGRAFCWHIHGPFVSTIHSGKEFRKTILSFLRAYKAATDERGDCFVRQAQKTLRSGLRPCQSTNRPRGPGAPGPDERNRNDNRTGMNMLSPTPRLKPLSALAIRNGRKKDESQE